jgi:hypothetical protein
LIGTHGRIAVGWAASPPARRMQPMSATGCGRFNDTKTCARATQMSKLHLPPEFRALPATPGRDGVRQALDP